MIGTPSFNPHAPGPFGDVTPSSIAGTTLDVTTVAGITFFGFIQPTIVTDSSGNMSIGNVAQHITLTGYDVIILGATTWTFEHGGGFSGNGPVRFTALPTSSSGLVSGDLWNNLGIVNIV